MSGSRRFTGRLAALSSAAIVAAYAAGYTLTERSADSATSVGEPSNALASTASATPPNRSGTTAAPTSTVAVQRPAVTATSAAAATAYRDGTYVGYATGRHGAIEATVAVEGGRIASVQISQCLTRYPCSRIAALPGQVVSRQSTQVDYVSGATDSSRTFVQAVTNALSDAR
ncbi:MAG: FMN-binding protein [Dehalococcoidia bacterium]